MRRRKPLVPGVDYAAAARLVLRSYEEFLATVPPAEEAGDSKAFAARHAAARAALAHLDQIEKLAGEDPAEDGSVAEQLAAARRAIAAEKETDPDDDGPRDDGGG